MYGTETGAINSPIWNPGYIWLGGYDQENYAASDFNFYDITPTSGSYGINLEAIVLDGQSIQIDETVVFDSGTSYIVLSSEIYEKFTDLIEDLTYTSNSLLYLNDCSSATN